MGNVDLKDIADAVPTTAELDKARKSFKKQTNFSKVLGVPNWILFHGWNILMIVDAISKYIWFQTKLFGDYHTTHRGILSMYSQEFMALAIGLVYMSYFCAGKDRPFVVSVLFKLNMIFIGVAMFCYAMDGFLWCYDPHTFCNLQLVKQSYKTCHDRNDYFMFKVLFFYVFWGPIWFGCASAMRRYARELASEGRG